MVLTISPKRWGKTTPKNAEACSVSLSVTLWPRPHMGDPHGDPQTSPQHADPLKRHQVQLDRRVVGWSAGRHVINLRKIEWGVFGKGVLAIVDLSSIC